MAEPEYMLLRSIYYRARNNRKIIGYTSLCCFFMLFLSFFVILPGYIGIVVTLGSARAFPPGPHFRLPLLSSLEVLTVKTQKLEGQNIIPTKEGLSVELDTAVLFRLDAARAVDIYERAGMGYVSLLIEPEAASAVRGLTSESEAKALYTSGRSLIQNAVKEELERKLKPLGIIVVDVLLKGIKLPRELTKSIELKAQAEQEAARMEFVLAKEKLEATRKGIEAEGIASFQKIVSTGISPQLLQWKGIEATERLAKSPNSKVIIVGNDRNSLPVLLSAGDDNAATNSNHTL